MTPPEEGSGSRICTLKLTCDSPPRQAFKLPASAVHWAPLGPSCFLETLLILSPSSHLQAPMFHRLRDVLRPSSLGNFQQVRHRAVCPICCLQCDFCLG